MNNAAEQRIGRGRDNLDEMAEHHSNAAAKPDSDGWFAPQELVTGADALPYPVDALPEVIRAAVVEVQAFTQAPVPLVAASALSAVSLAVQSLIDVERADKLQGPTGLYMLTIAESGERKSTCDGYFAKSIREYEVSQAELFAPAIRQYRADFEAWESARAGLKDNIRKLSKAGKDFRETREHLRVLEDEKPYPPRVPRLVYADATPEALAHGLAHDWPAGGIISAEAGLVFGAHGMGRDSVMRNLALLNALWDGGSVRIDRRTSDTFEVRGARLTVGLQVQPETLRSFFEGTKGLARGTGFLSRFLIAWPESTQGTRFFRAAPKAWSALTRFNARITQILESEPPIDNGALSPALLPFAPEAQAEWEGFHDEIEAGLSVGGELTDVRDVASKTADNAARLAALFHFIGGEQGAISNNYFEPATRIAAWHLNESRRLFGELCLPDELANAQRLDAWLIAACQQEKSNRISTSVVMQYGPQSLRKKAALGTAAAELEEMGRARILQIGRRRFLEVNPVLLRSAK